MESSQRSRTAEWVAIGRSAGVFLAPNERVAADPYGASFASPVLRGAFAAASRFPRVSEAVLRRSSPLRNFVLWMQLRTRAIDDALLAFVSDGAGQVVLLGAGHDMRAVRFRAALCQTPVFEVDHPSTQAEKRRTLAAQRIGSDARFVSFDFEREPIDALGARLTRAGHDPALRTLTIWEGVTMYLREPAIDASLRAIHAYSGHGSRLVVTYLDARAVRAPGAEQRLTQRLVARSGEPYVFGFGAGEFAPYVEKRGFDVLWDETDQGLAVRHLPPRAASAFPRRERHVAELASKLDPSRLRERNSASTPGSQ